MRLRNERRWRPGKSSYALMLVLTDEAYVAAALCIPNRKGDDVVMPSLGGSGAAFGGGAGVDGAGARGDDVVTPFVAVPGRDVPASTHVRELRRAALRRSMRVCREHWPERLLRRAGEVGASGLRLGERSSMR